MLQDCGAKGTGASGDQGENIGGSLRVGFSEFERTEKENDGK